MVSEKYSFNSIYQLLWYNIYKEVMLMKKYKYHVCIKQPFEHCDRIFPNQQKYVSEYKFIKKDENIKR